MSESNRSPGALAERTGRQIQVTRVFDAPRHLVFKAWTRPAHIGQWWGPEGFRTTTHEMDVRPGGVWRFVMHGPDGVDYANRIVYREVVEPERLAYDQHGGDDSRDPARFVGTVTFAEESGGTRLTLRMEFPSVEERDRVEREYGALEGAHQTLARLRAHLTTMV